MADETLCTTVVTACVTGAAAEEPVPVPDEEPDELAAEELGAVPEEPEGVAADEVGAALEEVTCGAVADELVAVADEAEEVGAEEVEAATGAVADETFCTTAVTACVTGAGAEELGAVPEEPEEVAAEGVGAAPEEVAVGAVADELVPVLDEVVPEEAVLEEAVTCVTADETAPVAVELSDELSAADALAVQSGPAPTARMPTAIATRNRRRAHSTIDS